MGRPTKRAAHRSHPYCKPLRSSIDHHIRLRQLLDHNDVTVGLHEYRLALHYRHSQSKLEPAPPPRSYNYTPFFSHCDWLKVER
ncbi:hypothetical protein EVAR_62176_1 [Eumeta japonica]|uniref:Uncharacterized protein n=1 Tax=Eumeta variegata TaxID=151549 RepID=A0A4C1ZUA7_EUMVA|nr:hypothetical protein EVAR_62176_1 [Eumeta japonica]